MSADELVEALGAEYDLPNGFVAKLRSGIFDQEGGERLVANLERLETQQGSVDLRLVQVLWHLPIVIMWQVERRETDGEDVEGIESVLARVVSILEDRIGPP